MNKLYGLVLAGGRSTRMGSDKSQLMFHGQPQADYLLHLLGSFCERVFLSVRPDHAGVGKRAAIVDQFTLDTPLNGLLSAFQQHPSVAWLTVPVDMPGIDAKAIAYLLAHRDTSRVATCFFDSEGIRPEPLFAIWETSCSRLLPAFHQQGGTSPRAFLMEHTAALLHAPDPRWLQNINTPEALAAWRQEQRN